MRYITILILALLTLSCGDELTKDPPTPPEEPKQASLYECQVCMAGDNYYSPPARFDCGYRESCVRWCEEYNCRRYARSGPGVQ